MVGKGKQGVKRMCGSDFGSLRRIRPLRAHVLFTCSAAIKQDDNLPRENSLTVRKRQSWHLGQLHDQHDMPHLSSQFPSEAAALETIS